MSLIILTIIISRHRLVWSKIQDYISFSAFNIHIIIDCKILSISMTMKSSIQNRIIYFLLHLLLWHTVFSFKTSSLINRYYLNNNYISNVKLFDIKEIFTFTTAFYFIPIRDNAYKIQRQWSDCIHTQGFLNMGGGGEETIPLL